MRIFLGMAFALAAGAATAQAVPQRNLCAEVKGTGGVTLVCTDIAAGQGLRLENRALPDQIAVPNPRRLVVCPPGRAVADTALQSGSGYIVRTDVVSPSDCN